MGTFDKIVTNAIMSDNNMVPHKEGYEETTCPYCSRIKSDIAKFMRWYKTRKMYKIRIQCLAELSSHSKQSIICYICQNV